MLNADLRRKRYKQKLLNTIRHNKSLAYKTATKFSIFFAIKKAQEVPFILHFFTFFEK